jgi:hypothetical protein
MLAVERQEEVVFSGTWATENRTDPMVGAVSADGKTLYLADDNGPMHGELRGPDGMEIWICQISRHFQAMMLDIASIDRKNRNISHCQVILARKLTEP